ncbi:MAG TPA: hypothetical protein VGR92_12065 [Steroidobacteraceae bacterium]|nr:hypothetical protein [Steroidobacteraceae bacterium]
MTSNSNLIAQYKAAVALHERTFRYLESINVDADTLSGCRQILHYLRTRTEDQILSLMGERAKTRHSSAPDDKWQVPDEVIRNLSLDKVKDYATDESTPRFLLEKIAIVRFGVPKSGVAARRGRKVLTEKIITLADHEMTHKAIVRAVADKDSRGS